MGYVETFLNCKTLEELKIIVTKEVIAANLLNPKKLTEIEKAIDEVRRVHPEWVEE